MSLSDLLTQSAPHALLRSREWLTCLPFKDMIFISIKYGGFTIFHLTLYFAIISAIWG